MAIDLTEAARAWSAEHPRAVEALTPLVPGGVAIFSSTFHAIVARALDLPPLRQPGDIDLLVPREQFGRAARRLGAVAAVGDIFFQTSDGHRASMYAREALALVGGDEVQFMDPRTKLQVGSARYDTRFTAEAVAVRTIIETDEGLVPLAHPVDTIGMYAVLQRGGAKQDGRHAAELIAASTALADPYALERALAMGWDERVWRFIGDASLAGATPAGVQPQPVLAA